MISLPAVARDGTGILTPHRFDERTSHFPTSKGCVIEEPEFEVLNREDVDVRTELVPAPPQSTVSTRSVVPALVSDRLEVNQEFQKAVPFYGKLQHLSYELVKGCNASSTKLLEDIQDTGWLVKGFEGLSGDVNGKANLDIPGLVAFNPGTGEAVVTFHGSQDADDWKNNLDAQMVFARDYKLNFDGRISKGYADRYNSCKQSLYEILDHFRMQNPANFHLTVVGHSLGGGVGELAVADLATDYAHRVWGSIYDNACENRVQAYLMSGALVFDEEAADTLETQIGKHNVVQDAVAYDPVYFVSGKSTAEYLDNRSAYGLMALGLRGLKVFGWTKAAHPKAVACLYGKGRHIGYEALQDVEQVQALAAKLETPEIQKRLAQEGLFAGWWKGFVGRNIAPIHYGSSQIKQDGSGKLTHAFEPALLQPETLSARIQRIENAKEEPQGWGSWLASKAWSYGQPLILW